MVLPGNNRLDSKKVRKTLNAKSFSFASRDEVLDITEGVKPGGVHPFGNLFGLEVFVDKSLSENKEIILNAGDRSVSIALDYQHFLNSIQPEVASFTE